jgi:HlyD family secretion protein
MKTLIPATPAEQLDDPVVAAPREPGVLARDTAAESTAPSAAPAASGRRRQPSSLFSRKRLVWGGLALGLLVLSWLALRPAALEVEVGAAVRGPLEITVDAEGVTRVRDRYQIATPIGGRVQRIALREGDAVAAGSILAHITPLPLDIQAATQARARLAAALAGQQEARTREAQAREALEQVERSTARIREVADAGGMSVDAVERVELQLAVARRDHDAADSRASAAAAEVVAARAALLAVDGNGAPGGAISIVRSPANGQVLRVYEPSERVVTAGTPLLEIGDAASLEVVVDVLSTDAVRIRPGATMRLEQWGGDRAVTARVRLVEPAGFTRVSALGVEEQRVNVVGDLIDTPAALGDGYRVEARIVTWEDTDVLKVPNSALFRRGAEWGVFVVENGRAKLRSVQIGHRGIHEAEVLGGLANGDAVVLFPSDRIQEGARVKPLNNGR